MSLTNDLRALEEWLQRSAPVSFASLRPPVSPAQLAEAAQVFGQPLHPNLVELLTWHDGTTNLPGESLQIAPDFGFIGLSDALDAWQTNNVVIDDIPQDHPLASWRSTWFPLGLDWCGGTLVVDHDQSGGGYGQVFVTEPEQGPRRDEGWTSIAALIVDVLESLESGQALRDWEPLVDEGLLIWQ